MSKSKEKPYEVGEQVYVDQFECDGVVKAVSDEVTEKMGPVYTVELDNGQTRHFTNEDLE